MIALEELDPITRSMTRMRPPVPSPYCGWRGSAISPVSGSTPPQKLSGLRSTRRRPSPWPSQTGVPISSTGSRPA